MSKKDEKDKYSIPESETERILNKLLEGTTNVDNVSIIKDMLEDRPISRCPDFKPVKYQAGTNDPFRLFGGVDLPGLVPSKGDIDDILSAYDREYGPRMPMINEPVYVRLPWQFEYEDIKEYRVGFVGSNSFILENFRELDESIAVLDMTNYGELWAYREYDLKVYIDKVKGDMF